MEPLLNHLRSRAAAFAHDLLMIPLAWMVAYWVRFNLGYVPVTYMTQAVHLLPFLIIIQGVVCWQFGLYRGLWRFASIPDLVRIGKAVIVGVCASGVVIFLFDRMQYVPRSVLPLYGALLFGLLSGPRGLYRWIKDSRLGSTSGNRVLIIGCGDAAEMLVRDLLRDREGAYRPVALVDDKLNKIGREIHGVRVVGTLSDLSGLATQLDIDLIVIAVPSATSKQMRRIVTICEETDVPFRTLPPISDLVAGQVTVRELREVDIEDLLGRDPVDIAWDTIATNVADKRILVSGGGGSIGSELCRQIARLNPTELVILERSESSLFSIEQELRRELPELRLQARLGDVCDRRMVDHIMRESRPEIVFHAAAYKHVPMLQGQVREAVRNNVLGTRNMAEAADRHAASDFVLISTDKAVNPVNVLGATKRVAEMICQAMNKRSDTSFIAVRFGNVLGSTGSVVPLFKQQIAAGGPVTVTDPSITRYFMTIAEATQLIIQASALGNGGEIFVLDMGEPVNIGYLAEQMIKLSGKQPGKDIEIVKIGLRPGEKCREELFYEDERPIPTAYKKILLIQPHGVATDILVHRIDILAQDVESFDDEALLDNLSLLVPEFGSTIGKRRQDNVIPLDRVTT